MKFGWLTLAHSPAPEHDQREIFEQLDQACLAENLGFDGVWLTEHNFTGESVYSDPIPFAAALAMRTSRIRIGFAVIQMALAPSGAAGDTAVAARQSQSKGRLDIGVGRGSIFNEYEFVGYGLSSDDARERMAEALEIMTRAWTDTPLDHKGRFYTLSLPELSPVPVQKPHPPIWHSVVTPPSFEACGTRGCAHPDRAVANRPHRRPPGPLRQGAMPRVASMRPRSASGCDRRRCGDGSMSARAAPRPKTRSPRHCCHTRQHMSHARSAFNPPDFAIPSAMLNPWTDTVVPDEEGIRFAMTNGTIVGSVEDVAEQIAELKRRRRRTRAGADELRLHGPRSRSRPRCAGSARRSCRSFTDRNASCPPKRAPRTERDEERQCHARFRPSLRSCHVRDRQELAHEDRRGNAGRAGQDGLFADPQIGRRLFVRRVRRQPAPWWPRDRTCRSISARCRMPFVPSCSALATTCTMAMCSFTTTPISAAAICPTSMSSAPPSSTAACLATRVCSAHWPDVGSATPGSYGAVTEIYGEGLRLPPVRLVSQGANERRPRAGHPRQRAHAR